MSRAPIIIVEAELRWQAAWRRQDPSAWIAHAPSLSAGDSLLHSGKASVLVVEATLEALPDVVDWLLEIRRRRLSVFVIAVANAALEERRWELMECGADWVVTSERRLSPAVDAARRFLANTQPIETTFRERIWDSLPWS